MNTLEYVYPLIGSAGRRLKWRGAGRLTVPVARWLVKHSGGVCLGYRDSLGFERQADLGDPLEAHWFMGINVGLPGRVLDLINPGDTVIDAGANVGIIPEQLCRRVGTDGQVLAIEPLIDNARRLRELKRDNQLPQLEILENALADRRGSRQLRTSGPGVSPYASFTKSWLAGETVSVETRTLDEITPAGGRVAFLKLDIEGAEPLALRGATTLLATHRPIIYCEFNDQILRDAGLSGNELLQAFARLGYQVAPEDRDKARQLDNRVTDLLLESR